MISSAWTAPPLRWTINVITLESMDSAKKGSFSRTKGQKTEDGTFPPEQTVTLTTLGDVLPYAAVTTASWLSATPEFGIMPGSITVSAMMGLISTAVTSRLPDASARATSQPPPGPMMSVFGRLKMSHSRLIKAKSSVSSVETVLASQRC